MQQQSTYQQPNYREDLVYKEPQYKVKPTWSLAWGLLWRMWVLCIPIYLILFALGEL